MAVQPEGDPVLKFLILPTLLLIPLNTYAAETSPVPALDDLKLLEEILNNPPPPLTPRDRKETEVKKAQEPSPSDPRVLQYETNEAEKRRYLREEAEIRAQNANPLLNTSAGSQNIGSGLKNSISGGMNAF